ncbi:MAG: hypothetical protein ACR5LF_07215 [Symbiopectobacterium sp.]
MLNTLIVGASGYTGTELALDLNRHTQMNLTALAVSAQSVDAGKRISDLHTQLKDIIDLPVKALTDAAKPPKASMWCFWPQAAWCSISPVRFACRMLNFIAATTVSSINTLTGWRRRCMAWPSFRWSASSKRS